VSSGRAKELEGPKNWKDLLQDVQEQQESDLRGCTYAGKPFGEDSFVRDGRKVWPLLEPGSPEEEEQFREKTKRNISRGESVFFVLKINSAVPAVPFFPSRLIILYKSALRAGRRKSKKK